MLAELRQTIARLERPAARLEDAGVQPFGILAIDAALGGGITRGALHEIAAPSEAHVAAATGFVLGVCCLAAHAGRTPSPRLRGEGWGEGEFPQHRARGESSSPGRLRFISAVDPRSSRGQALSPQAGRGKQGIVWIAEDMALAENGAPCGTGLDEFGLHPECLLTVAAARPCDLLWAMEEALRCPAVDTVIGELRHETIDAVALRRLSLAAQEHSALALLLRAAPSDDVSTAATRWIVGAANSCVTHGPGPPRIDAHLVRNRCGPLGSWQLEWSVSDERFVLTSAHPQPVAQPAADRPARAVA